MISPENFVIIEGHEPVASSGLGDTSNAICLEGAKGVLILIHEDFAVDANQLVLTIHEGESATVAEAGTYAVSATFRIWTNLTCQTSDTWTRQTDAATYTINSTAGDNCMVAFYVPASILTDGRPWVHLGSSAGDAGNIVDVIYILDGGRYQQAEPPAVTS